LRQKVLVMSREGRAVENLREFLVVCNARECRAVGKVVHMRMPSLS
jgi:hypothetical protein